MVLEESYKEDVLEWVYHLSDKILTQYGYDKYSILDDQDIVYQLWISYQKNIVEYELDRTQAFFCTLKDVLAIDMPSTEEEEREALEKIKHILKSLGEGSHCANAFKGCVELAEKYIEENAAFSFPDCLQKKDDKISEQSSQIEMLKGLIPDMKKPLDEAL